MAEIHSTIEKLELLDGKTVELTLNFKKLLYLRTKGYEKEVNEAMSLLHKKGLDVLEIPTFLYAAYLCATEKPAYSQDEFIALVPFDINRVYELFTVLNGQKKTPPLKKPSSAKAAKKAK